MSNPASVVDPVDLSCPRCGAPGRGFAGCGRCRADGVPVNLVPALADLGGLDLALYPGGPWGWPEAMPVRGSGLDHLGEGNTPLVRIQQGPGGTLWIKDESRNPTGTHKDRAMTVGIAAARKSGASTVVVASTGNAGAAAAAYAARAGLLCVVLTTTAITGALADQIRSLGAALVAYADISERNRMMEAAVDALGWYPLTNYVLPCVGGNPYANEGYKSIAYELARDLGAEIETIVVPTSAADLLAGIERGYRELAHAGLVADIPRLVAAETATAAPFTEALRHPDRGAQERTSVEWQPSPAFSLGDTHPTWQGLQALWKTEGAAIAVEVEDYMAEHRRLPATTGLFLEAAAAVAVTVARRLLGEGARRVVAIGTSTGLKAPAAETGSLRAAPGGLAALKGRCEEWFASRSGT